MLFSMLGSRSARRKAVRVIREVCMLATVCKHVTQKN
jgi:hypothetical protein